MTSEDWTGASGRQMASIEGMETVFQYESSHLDGQKGLNEAEKQMRDEEISFYSNSEHEHGDDNIWGLLTGVGGNIYEWWVLKETISSP
jgi:hypothetical protein